ncbi:hypothetical protein ACFXMV_03085 [Rhodococcus sp. NPDC059179]|uniref:hypothetical protein n=1 Tax=Rhodococcus sp. NPDC059179 TaxID=3346760 RepID=UPI00366DE89B
MTASFGLIWLDVPGELRWDFAQPRLEAAVREIESGSDPAAIRNREVGSFTIEQVLTRNDNVYFVFPGGGKTTNGIAYLPHGVPRTADRIGQYVNVGHIRGDWHWVSITPAIAP